MRDENLLNIYETAVLMFGIIPVLRLLKRAEAREDFDECEIIKSAVEDLNRMTGGTMPTKLEEVEIEKIKSAFDRFGGQINGEQYERAIDSYTRQAIEYVSTRKLELTEIKNLKK